MSRLASQEIIFSPADFVAVFNQTINYAYPKVTIVGELANFRVSKNRWVYFDLKDESASLKFFGSVYVLPGPLEEGMLLRVVGTPQLHQQYGFSITMQSIQLTGEGTLKKAAKLLEAKLAKEGLFDSDRKRPLPYPPNRIGLIASGESAAYSDFVKVLAARWPHIKIEHYDVLVQGEQAPEHIQRAIEYFNKSSELVDVLVVTRGGGSADDLQAFDAEPVVRAVAASRIPTLVAIGHERDESLAERAADVRASTPSNAAELLTPDQVSEKRQLKQTEAWLADRLQNYVVNQQQWLEQVKKTLNENVDSRLSREREEIRLKEQLIASFNPRAVLSRGYSIVRQNDKPLRSVKKLDKEKTVEIELSDGRLKAKVQ